jgi:hypothetical protein
MSGTTWTTDYLPEPDTVMLFRDEAYRDSPAIRRANLRRYIRRGWAFEQPRMGGKPRGHEDMARQRVGA